MSNIRKTSGSRAVIYDLSSARARSTSATADPADKSGISDDARELSRARGAVDQAQDVRAERVAALRAQIARGEYRADPREVARKILERGI
ncbi:MAG: flagellar biosynthesis anti-sigma factor FlgM [Dehalococcoidia bacterium]|nr:flagellar biosynthesis anti-sigma factor FlgM [Dehalococcoidia bacterium]